MTFLNFQLGQAEIENSIAIHVQLFLARCDALQIPASTNLKLTSTRSNSSHPVEVVHLPQLLCFSLIRS